MSANARKPRSIGVHAIEAYLPRHSVNAAALEIYDACPGAYTRGALLSTIRRCGADEDLVSMSLTTIRRLCDSQQLALNAVGMLHFGTQELMDRSKVRKERDHGPHGGCKS